MKMSTIAATVPGSAGVEVNRRRLCDGDRDHLLGCPAAPTPIYRFYRETLGLTPFTITFIFATYAFTMIAAFLTIARLSDYVGRKPMIAVGARAQRGRASPVLRRGIRRDAGRLRAPCRGLGPASRWRRLARSCRHGAMGGHAQQRDGVHRPGARRAHLGRVRRLCALADAPGLCRAARRDAHRDGRPRLDRQNDVAKARRLERDQAQTDRAESRGRRDGAPFPADPLRLGAGRILLSLMPSLVIEATGSARLSSRRRRLGADGLRRPFVVGDARPRRRA